MKRISIFFFIPTFLIQGCFLVNTFQNKILEEETEVKLKKYIAKVPNIAKCIADKNSHGICTKCNNRLKSQYEPTNISLYDYEDALLKLDTTPKSIPVLKIKLSDFDTDLNLKSGDISKKVKSIYQKHQTSHIPINLHAAERAKRVLLSNTNKNINKIFDISLDKEPNRYLNHSIDFTKTEVDEFIEDLKEAYTYNGFGSLKYLGMQQLIMSKDSVEKESLAALIVHVNYIEEYFKAYFRNGHFIEGKIEAKKLFEKLTCEIKKEAHFLTEKQVDTLTKQLYKKLTGTDFKGGPGLITFAGKIEKTQFVTRAGIEYGFPNVTVEINPQNTSEKISITKIDWNNIGGEIAKVFVEALGDQFIGLPADARSTICKIDSNTCFKANDPVSGNLSAKEFASVNEFADRVDVLVTGAVGKAIRGVGWISLNNEAIAKIIESLIGTAARKIAEKAAYCSASCLLCNEQNANLILYESSLEEITIKITYE